MFSRLLNPSKFTGIHKRNKETTAEGGKGQQVGRKDRPFEFILTTDALPLLPIDRGGPDSFSLSTAVTDCDDLHAVNNRRFSAGGGNSGAIKHAAVVVQPAGLGDMDSLKVDKHYQNVFDRLQQKNAVSKDVSTKKSVVGKL